MLKWESSQEEEEGEIIHVINIGVNSIFGFILVLVVAVGFAVGMFTIINSLFP